MQGLIFQLLKGGNVVGYEHHRLTNRNYSDVISGVRTMRISHSSNIGGTNDWDLREWPDRFIEHDGKVLLNDTADVGPDVNDALPLARHLLRGIIAADPNVIDDYKCSDLVIRGLYNQCQELVEKLGGNHPQEPLKPKK